MTAKRRGRSHSHLTDEKTKAQRVYETYLRSLAGTWQRWTAKSNALDSKFCLDLFTLHFYLCCDYREGTTLSIWGSATKWLNWIVLKIEKNIAWLKGVKIVFLPPGLVYTDCYSVFSSPRRFLCVLCTVPAWETVREVFPRILRHFKWKKWH